MRIPCFRRSRGGGRGKVRMGALALRGVGWGVLYGLCRHNEIPHLEYFPASDML